MLTQSSSGVNLKTKTQSALKNIPVQSKVSKTHLAVEFTSFNVIHRRRWKHLVFWWGIFDVVWSLR